MFLLAGNREMSFRTTLAGVEVAPSRRLNLFNSARRSRVSIKHSYIALMYDLGFSGDEYSNMRFQRRALIKTYERVGVGLQS